MTELNLIPYSLKKKRRNKLRYTQYICFGILFLCMLFWGLYFPMGTLNKLNLQVNSLQEQAKDYESIASEGQSIQNDINTLNKFINKVNGLTTNKVIIVDEIRGLQAFMPQDLTFNNLNYSAGVISINGEATSYSSISEFAANLQMSQNYSGAKLSNITYDKLNNLYNFTLIIK